MPGARDVLPTLNLDPNLPVFARPDLMWRPPAIKPPAPPQDSAADDPDYFKSSTKTVPNILPFLPDVTVTDPGDGKSASRFRFPFDGQPNNLEPVKDPAITKGVPDATYIGYHGDIRLMTGKKSWEVREKQPYWLAKPAAHALEDANRILNEKGKSVDLFGMNSAGRQHEQQEAIRKLKTATVFAKGTSRHELGRAIDIRNYYDKDVRDALKDVGFVWGNAYGSRRRPEGTPIKNDPVHFSFRDDKYFDHLKKNGRSNEISQFAPAPDKAVRIAHDRAHEAAHSGRRHSHGDVGRTRRRHHDDDQPVWHSRRRRH